MNYGSFHVHLLNNLLKIMETDSIIQPYIQLFFVTLHLVKSLFPRDLAVC